MTKRKQTYFQKRQQAEQHNKKVTIWISVSVAAFIILVSLLVIFDI